MALDDLGCPDTRFGATTHTREEGLHVLESFLTCDRCIDYLSQGAGARNAHQGSGRNEVGEIEAWNRQLFRVLHNRCRADRDVRLEGVHGVQIILE